MIIMRRWWPKESSKEEEDSVEEESLNIFKQMGGFSSAFSPTILDPTIWNGATVIENMDSLDIDPKKIYRGKNWWTKKMLQMIVRTIQKIAVGMDMQNLIIGDANQRWFVGGDPRTTYSCAKECKWRWRTDIDTLWKKFFKEFCGHKLVGLPPQAKCQVT